MTNQLSSIKNFDQLIRYLEDELDWPCQEYGFEEITFKYTPEELGIKEEDSVQIKQIHQLRPFFQGQPWGIFFIEFEKKRLPVALLRRVLSHLVVKRRASANPAEQAVWNIDNLLFISAFGSENSDQREIAFAHFNQDSGDLPTLKVLGWDGADTVLKMEFVDKELHEKLHWPKNPKDATAWKSKWSSAFRHKPGHVIRTAIALADRLAELARGIRAAAETLMEHESEKGSLRKLHKAFQIALIHDLSEKDFADTYAQTITYGLLTAAISRTDMSGGVYGTALIAENVTDMVPITNPFLKEMLETFIHAGDRKGGIQFDELGIQDVVELLRGEDTDLPAILGDFNNRAPGEDPVIHFYQHFLSAYNKQLKIQRGVFYTPQPVVSYIVRSVHELLKIEFEIEDGLASTISWGEIAHRNPNIKIPEGVLPTSPFVQILDPATGTATFLVEVIAVIFQTLTAKWKQERLSMVQQQAAWNDYVPKHLLPRLYGYELMMAPYAIAHMKVGLKLFETGYNFGSNERVRIYLTNSLEPASNNNTQLKFDFGSSALAHESEAVNYIKSNQNFTIVIGNPPYAGHSWNLKPELRQIVEKYRYVNGQRIKEKGALQLEKSIQDDYIKFFRLAEMVIANSGIGILGMVTSHGFLDNPFLRGMRFSIINSFNKIFVLDLHGNSLRKEKCPDGSLDKNVFEIKRTGIAISLFRKSILNDESNIVHSDLWGNNETIKYLWLKKNSLSTTERNIVGPKPPHYLLIPQTACNIDEYDGGQSIAEIMQTYSKGVVTGRDAFVIDFNESVLLERMRMFVDKNKSEKWLIEKYHLNPSDWWNVSKARENMPPEDQFETFIRPLLYRPFDIRPCFYHPSVFMSPRRPVMMHMEPKNHNILLVTSRMTKGEPFQHVTLAKGLAEAILLSSKTSNNAIVFPLYLYPKERPDSPSLNLVTERKPNFSKSFVVDFINCFGITIVDGFGDFSTGIGVEDILNYFVAILFSPSYRSRYSVQLTRDFPRIPLTNNLSLFRDLCQRGKQLVSLNLLEAPVLNNSNTRFHGRGDNSVQSGYPKYDSQQVLINTSQGFEGVPQDVWEFQIGGYQVCHKWLKDRRGRQLSEEDITHYQKIVVALKETIRIMGEIDEVIEEHGGWPIS